MQYFSDKESNIRLKTEKIDNIVENRILKNVTKERKKPLYNERTAQIAQLKEQKSRTLDKDKKKEKKIKDKFYENRNEKSELDLTVRTQTRESDYNYYRFKSNEKKKDNIYEPKTEIREDAYKTKHYKSLINSPEENIQRKIITNNKYTAKGDGELRRSREINLGKKKIKEIELIKEITNKGSKYSSLGKGQDKFEKKTITSIGGEKLIRGGKDKSSIIYSSNLVESQEGVGDQLRKIRSKLDMHDQKTIENKSSIFTKQPQKGMINSELNTIRNKFKEDARDIDITTKFNRYKKGAVARNIHAKEKGIKSNLATNYKRTEDAAVIENKLIQSFTQPEKDLNQKNEYQYSKKIYQKKQPSMDDSKFNVRTLKKDKIDD